MAQLPRNYVEEVELVTQPVATEMHDEPVATAEAQVRQFSKLTRANATPRAWPTTTDPRTSMARELAIGSGAIAAARATARRCCRSGSWRRSGRRQG